jgi:hypothetical protein
MADWQGTACLYILERDSDPHLSSDRGSKPIRPYLLLGMTISDVPAGCP